MSHPSWLPPKNAGEPVSHVRMETTPSFGTPSISVSTQQTPKKFAPVVAPKPKFNPYKPGTQSVGDDGDFPPPPPPSMEDLSNLPLPSGSFPPPPPGDDEAVFDIKVKTGGKTIEERRSSLDAEIDSLTSILADLESTSPYKSRNQQGYGTLGASTNAPSASTPVTGHKRMIIPTQPPLTATKKSAAKPQPAPQPQVQPQAFPQPPVNQVTAAPVPKPQPVPASYTTALTPTKPTFNVQIKTAQPGPQFLPPSHQPVQGVNQPYVPQQVRPPGQPYYTAAPRGPDFVHPSPQQVRLPEPSYGAAPPPVRYQDPYYAGGQMYGGRYGPEPVYVNQNTWKPEPAYPLSTGVQLPAGAYQPANIKKTYITDPAPAAPALQPKGGYPSSFPATGPPMAPAPAPVPTIRPEDELERLTKKMLYDMEHPPTNDFFGRCARCGENVVGEGTGCTAMDQVFHVDCFTCMTCNTKLRGHPFYAVEKKAYCEPCYISTLEKCSVCSKPIMERILRATGKPYHPHCFTCVVCHRSLDGIPFTVDAASQIHCIEDFHRKFAPRCSVCKEPIMPAPGQEETIRIVALDRDFHVQCYRCEDCKCLLSEGDNQGCYPLDGCILCKTCNSARIQAMTVKTTTDL